VASAPQRDDGARAKALLEGKPAAAASAPAGARYVVQIGAFAEARTVREVRAKAEKAGLSTYTQVVTVPDGERTRVRVGPFGSRDEAEAAAAKAKKAGLPASVIRL
jgi:DedD protein